RVRPGDVPGRWTRTPCGGALRCEAGHAGQAGPPRRPAPALWLCGPAPVPPGAALRPAGAALRPRCSPGPGARRRPPPLPVRPAPTPAPLANPRRQRLPIPTLLGDPHAPALSLADAVPCLLRSQDDRSRAGAAARPTSWPGQPGQADCERPAQRPDG